MKVLVCGGRDYTDYWTVHEILTGIHRATPISCLIEGGALGADRFARQWAINNKVFYETFSADWKTHGKAAGPIRNKRMLMEGKPECVIAFPGGKGTANMVAFARDADVPVVEIEDGP
jgi:hypothetical protein